MKSVASPFNEEHLRILQVDPENITSLEITSGEVEYSYICSYVSQECGCDSVLRLDVEESCSDVYSDEEYDEPESGNSCADRKFKLGLGTFKITFNEEPIYLIHAVHGKPAGFSCLKYYTTLVLIVPGLHRKHILASFVDKAASWGNKTNHNLMNIYSWDVENHYWAKTISKRKRDMETVILPAVIKQKLINDLKNFLGENTSRWYAKHGIPYKRSYLFYGPPGTGKTSTITALAAHIDRNVAYLHVSDPKMTDSLLKKALQRLPGNCVVVLEDVDALFSVNRSKVENIPLSFSGLLNALDGIGGKDAAIFVLTSNHIDRLDPALIRPGRVDLHLEYPKCITDEQIELMFKQFYPEADSTQTRDFVDRVIKVRACFENMSTATLQQYFIVHRTSDLAEAIQSVDKEIDSPFAKPNLASLATFSKAEPEEPENVPIETSECTSGAM